LSTPTLSSIARDTASAAYEAANVLDLMMSGNKVEPVRITVHATHIVTRESTEVLAVQDREVAEALAFIKENSMRNIQVNDVAERVAMSRRNLHRRFVKTIGRTIHDEIMRVRINRVAELLLSTNYTVSQICYTLGLSNHKHIARQFKKIHGCSPLAYRKLHTARSHENTSLSQ
jgi:LacI family transcriptional regulator